MEFIILGLLMIQDMTVYQLNQSFNSGLSLIYSASYGSLLSAIKKLLKLGHIEFTEVVENGRNKKIYHITASGRDYFHEWMFAEIPENKLEMVALSKVFFLGLIDSDEDKRKIVGDIVDDVNVMLSKLNQLSEIISQYELGEEELKIYRYQMRTLDYGIKMHQVAKDWFQDFLEEI